MPCSDTRPHPWFAKDPAFDDLVGQRFLSLTRRAITAELDAWDAEPTRDLALVLLGKSPRLLGRRNNQGPQPTSLSTAVQQMASRYYLVFWSRRTRAHARHKAGYGTLLSARQANAADRRLIRKGVWVRRRKDGSSPQFGTAAARTAVRRQRSRYRSWL